MTSTDSRTKRSTPPPSQLRFARATSDRAGQVRWDADVELRVRGVLGNLKVERHDWFFLLVEWCFKAVLVGCTHIHHSPYENTATGGSNDGVQPWDVAG